MAKEAATGVEQTAMTHVDGFVRTVLGVAAGAAADLPAMPRDLSRLLLRTEELETDVRDRWGRWEFEQSENFRRGKLWKPEVAVWLARAAERDEAARSLAHAIRARGESAMRRAASDADVPAAASDLDEATFHLRALGLTWRELGILRELERVRAAGEHLERDVLAQRLGVSPNTLRVHLTRIRAKLDVGDKRGDEVLLDAALAQRRALA